MGARSLSPSSAVSLLPAQLYEYSTSGTTCYKLLSLKPSSYEFTVHTLDCFIDNLTCYTLFKRVIPIIQLHNTNTLPTEICFFFYKTSS